MLMNLKPHARWAALTCALALNGCADDTNSATLKGLRCQPEAPALAGVLEHDLVGVWQEADQGLGALLIFHADGRWQSRGPLDSTAPSRQGRFEAYGDTLTLHTRTSSRSDSVRLRPGLLTILIDGDGGAGVRYMRVSCDQGALLDHQQPGPALSLKPDRGQDR